ncbi:MAG TPA: CHAP domain-containing protein, partial [Solirubrobacteraceae bacterium]|nr:CHAP domain-containing protein [Solirubrobacteraceae bacterium]
ERLDSRSDRALALAIRRGARLERLVAQRRPLDAGSIDVLEHELGRLGDVIGEMRRALAEAAEPAVNGNGHHEAVTDIAARLQENDEAGDALREALADRMRTLEAQLGRHVTVERPATTKPVKPARKDKRTPAATLKLTTPLMKGRGIAALQRAVNRQMAAWKVDQRIKVDGEYGTETRDAVRRVAYGLGLSTKAVDHGVTPELRERICDPKRRTAAERERARARRPWLRRLRRRYDGHGPAAAIAYARKHLNVREDAGRPNRGRMIDKWNTATGIPLNSQAYWCGAFVNACLTAAGLPPDHVLAYCPSIENRAKAGTGGWSWQSKPRPGDLALFTHGGVAGHVGLVERVEGSTVITIEGNTSPNGTTNNGYGVFRRRRPLPIRGFARPPYDR